MLINLRGYYETVLPHDEWTAVNTRLLVGAESIGDDPAMVAALYNIGCSHVDKREHREAIQCLQKALTITRRLGDEVGSVDILSFLSVAYIGMDKLDLAAECVKDNLSFAQRTENKQDEGAAHHNLAALYRKAKRFDLAMDHARAAIATLRDCDAQYGLGLATAYAGLILASQDRHDEAITWFEQALPIARREKTRRHRGSILRWYGQSLRATGRLAGGASSLARGTH